MPDFFQTYFIDPIIYNTGYNVVNTAVFAVVLIAAVFLVYRLLRILGIKIDKGFFIGVIPFIALGGILRSWEDLLEATGVVHGLGELLKSFVLTDAAGTSRNLLLISPMIYVVIFFVALLTLMLAKLLEKYRKTSYWKIWFFIGILLDIAVLSQLVFRNSFAFFAVLGISAVWVAVLLSAKKLSAVKNLKAKEFFTNENTLIVNAHMFDATTTFVALSYFSYFEQHVLPGFVIGILGPASMFLLKLAVVPAVLYIFDREMQKPEDLEKRTFLKIVILILGMGPGIRNFLRMVMGV